MSNPKHREIFFHGVKVWNDWRDKEPDVEVDLSEFVFVPTGMGWSDLRKVNFKGADLSSAHFLIADLEGANFSGAKLGRTNIESSKLTDANFSGANLFQASLPNLTLKQANFEAADLIDVDLSGSDLSGANLARARLFEANLSNANLTGANLTGADLIGADLSKANLTGADLTGADLIGADLSKANLTGADLTGADLSRAQLFETDLVDATLTDCRIYGVSAWDVKFSEKTKQDGLIITREHEPAVTIDDLEVAQFVYLLLQNEKIRRVIDTITSKVVLILGRFSLPERKQVLDALRNELRKPGRNYVPVVFDFEKPRSQTTINTITLLARMARFVIADISDAKSVLQELDSFVEKSPKLAVQPIIVAGQETPGMFDSFEAYPWFLKVYRYLTPAQLLDHLDDCVIRPVEAEVEKLRK